MPIAFVLVAADMMTVVEHLKIAVLLDHPTALLPDERLEDRGSVFIVVVGREYVANVMQQRGNNPIDIRPVTPRPRG